MQQIHGGHFGIEKCKLRAKSCVYWPSVYKEIENLCKFMLRLPEVPQFSTKGAYDTIRDPFKTMANIERRPVLRPTVVVPHSCRLLSPSSHLSRSFTTSQPEPLLMRWKCCSKIFLHALMSLIRSTGSRIVVPPSSA